ncbi:MAG: cytochrome C [Acidobacteria bacterium]|jgi:mono/diheme cytochrome c family protein|nr:cytochrome C [Acidobacteriota bacterium]|tara:strand:+ start:476 stop:886 length:411 start_codon:yes stop_codon:yes gene_type:complete
MALALALAVLLLSGVVDAADDAQARYLLHCRGCHLANGTGVPPDVPTLVDEIGRLVATPVGREYVVRVPGVSQAALDDEGLASLLNWILETFNADTLPANFRPYSAGEITEARKKVLADPLTYRRALRLDGTRAPN